MTRYAAKVIGTGQRRLRVCGDRVECWRIGWVDLDRCRECLYLERLEIESPASRHVVCADGNRHAEPDFAW
jgi:hypothetical protein